MVVPNGAPSESADNEPAAELLPARLGFNGDNVDCPCALIELLE